MSPFHLHRTFAALFRETPHGYLTRRRLEVATDRLRSTRRSLAEIGWEVGFQSPATFSRLLKRRTGRTATEWRSGRRGGPDPGTPPSR
jgi:AraC family transcriptional regulator